MDSVGGGVLLFSYGRYFSAGDACTSSEGTSLWGVFVLALPENFANLGSLKCHFQNFDIICEVV